MTDRLTSERQFHDEQAQMRARALGLQPEKLRFADRDYLQHESWIVPALAHFGDVAGQSVLEFGCGHGMASVVLARRGARVTAFDLSFEYLLEARSRAEANDVTIDLVQADGERLPFADESFDGIWGNAVLHHLDIRGAGAEIHRVLRPSGVAVFCEPWGGNALLNWARQRLPYYGKQRTVDETPLGTREVTALQEIFPRVEVQGFQLFSMVRRVCRFRPVVAILNQCDELLLSCVPALQRYCRYVVIALRRC